MAIVASSYFQAGDQVKAGDELVEFEALTEECCMTCPQFVKIVEVGPRDSTKK